MSWHYDETKSKPVIPKPQVSLPEVEGDSIINLNDFSQFNIMEGEIIIDKLTNINLVISFIPGRKDIDNYKNYDIFHTNKRLIIYHIIPVDDSSMSKF